jgi:hypothetical protein
MRPAFACDICGCANSGSYFGLMPQSQKSVVGLRYQRMNFVTHPESAVLRTEEVFNIAELYTRFFPIKRVQILAFVPYRFDLQKTSTLTKKQHGIGDLSVLAHYNLFNTFMDQESVRKFNHTLLVGGGMKAPTGSFKFDEDDILQVANANFQLGTGSTDFMLNAFYTLNWNQWGMSTNISRKFNTTNSQGYKFGNQIYGTADLYRSFAVGAVNVTPSLGIYAEKSNYGSKDQVELPETGGKLLNGTIGVTFATNQWTLGLNAQTPLTQKSSSGHVVTKDRIFIQLGWLF